jgi:thiamine biosynthesis lipoprotein ApbE
MNLPRQFLMTLLLGVMLAGNAGATPTGALGFRSQNFLDAPLGVSVWARDQAVADEAARIFLSMAQDLEERLSSRWQGSVVNRINLYAGRQPVALAPEEIASLRFALQIADLSGGRYDPSLAPVLWHHGFAGGTTNQIPSDLLLDQLRPLVNYRFIVLDTSTHEILFKKQEMKISLDELLPAMLFQQLRSNRLTRFKAAWQVGWQSSVARLQHGVELPPTPLAITLAHPQAPMIYWFEPFEGVLVMVSIYQSGYWHQGTWVHPFLDPRTGKPLPGLDHAIVFSAWNRHVLPASLFLRLPPEQAVALAHKNQIELQITSADSRTWITQNWQRIRYRAVALPTVAPNAVPTATPASESYEPEDPMTKYRSPFQRKNPMKKPRSRD